MLFVFMLDFCIYFCKRFFIDDVFLFFKIGEKDNWFVFFFDLVLSFVKRFWNEMFGVGGVSLIRLVGYINLCMVRL